MMISKYKNAEQDFVWIWLPKSTKPIVAGNIQKKNNVYHFIYGKSYLQRSDAIPLSPFELPLQSGSFAPTGINIIHSCLRDSAPDAWGRRLINYQYSFLDANELDYMLLSGSNRIGALDFQLSNTKYISRKTHDLALKDLILAAEYIEKNQPLPEQLQYVLLHGTSVGGARPKAIIQDHITKTEFIAKFGSTTDIYNVIKAEYIAMRLAKLTDINVPDVLLKSALGKDILLIKRFDREINTNNEKTRKLMLSGLSILGLNELEARYASYCDFADLIRKDFLSPSNDLKELYKRLIFNILIGNNDDHARNHSAFWDGENLELTPAYDICPQPRVGFETTQAMAIEGKEGNFSTLTNALSVCEKFQILSNDARNIIDNMISIIKKNWALICDEAKLTKIEQEKLWGKSIFNPFCFRDY